MAEFTKQIRDVNDYEKFKSLVGQKYDSEVVGHHQEQGIGVLELATGDEVRYWDDKKLIGNPFGRRGKGNRIPAHFTKTKYSEFGYKAKGNGEFITNYAMKFGAGTLAYAKSLGLNTTQIRKAEASGIGNADDERLALREFMDSLKSESKPAKLAKTMPSGLSVKKVKDGYEVIHIKSGNRLMPFSYPEKELATDFARRAGQVGVDWTRPFSELQKESETIADLIRGGKKPGMFEKVLDMPTTFPKSSVSSRLAKFKPVSLGRNPKFTGTRGEMEAMDKPDLFKRRYIDNLEAHLEDIQWRLSNDIYGDAPVVLLQTEAKRILNDLNVAKRMSANGWDAYIAVFQKSPMGKIPMVSDIKPVKPKQEVKLVSPAMVAIYGEKRAREIAESNRKDMVERFKYARLDGNAWVDTRTGKKFAWKGEYPDLEPSGKTTDLQFIHDSRSPRSKESDERQSNADTVEPDDPRVERWVKDQGRLDIVGIDTPRKHRGKRAVHKVRKSTRTETQVRGISRR